MFDLKTTILIITFVLGGVIAYFGNKLANAKEFADVRVAATALEGKVDNGIGDIGDLKKAVETLNSKVDVLLIDQGHNPRTIESLNQVSRQ